VLLQEGIGDTIRVSLTPEPNGSRTQEVVVAQEILQTMGLRAFTPMVTACPGCGRTTSTLFQELASDVQNFVRDNMPVWREQFDGVENMTLAVMGCIVNGPGESKHANIGISLPGTGESPRRPCSRTASRPTLRGDNIANEFKAIIETYVARTYPRKARRPEPAPIRTTKGIMSKTLQAVRGMNDILPDDAEVWEQFEDIVRDWLHSYGYRPIRMPIVEPTPLFKRAIGEVTSSRRRCTPSKTPSTAST
jgi:hypothetical protein